MQILGHPRVSPHGDHASGPHRASYGWPLLFGSWRGLLTLSLLAVALAAVAVSQNWIAFATLLPLIYVLPCAAMMYMCMKHTKP